MLLLLLAFSCKPTSADVYVPPALTVAVRAAPAFDPVLGGPVPITVEASAPDVGTVTVRLLDASDAEVWVARVPFRAELVQDLEWDGLLADGSRASAGAYRIEATVVAAGATGADPEPAHADLALVRAGFESAYAEGDGGETALRVPLYWHVGRVLQDEAEAFTRVESIDASPGELPAPGDDLGTATAAEPLGFRYDSRPILTLVPGESLDYAGSGLDAAEIHLRVDGWTVLAGAPLQVGQPVVLQRDAPLASGPSVVEETLSLEFEAVDDEGTPWSLGAQLLPMRTYALLGGSGFSRAEANYQPWVAVVDPALRAIGGVAADHDAVVDALVLWIFDDLGLTYDTRYGASAYVDYRQSDWKRAHFYLESFLDRRYGSVINCTDCAAILGAYANMLGATLSYTIILEDFDLNLILAIGGDDFTRCPFGPGGCGFSYHAVTTDDGGGTIWDATLALDGDDAPGEMPATALPVQSIDGEEYLWRLAKEPARYDHESQGTIQ